MDTLKAPPNMAMKGNLHLQYRQKFLYEALYKNVRAELEESIKVRRYSVHHRELDPYYRVTAQQGVYSNTFWLWMSEYTAGENLDTLAQSFSSVVDEFVRWNELNVPFRLYLKEKYKEQGDTDLRVCAVDFNNQIEYENALQLISIAILIRDGRSTKRIIAAMYSNRYLDALREENRVTSDFDTPLGLDDYPLSRLRCEAGQPCPQAGWWLTPAKANSRRHFTSGEIMPAIENSSHGSTIWQWDIDQSASST